MKSILGYLAIVFILIFYTFFFDGETGFVLLLFFIIAPIFSLVIAIITAKNIDLTMSADEIADKKSSINVNLMLKKKTVMPTSLIFMNVSASKHLSSEESLSFMTLLFFNKKSDINFKMKADISGNAEVRLDNVYIMDYLRIFKIKVKRISKIPISVLIIPRIHENDTASEFVYDLSGSVIIEDDEENSINQYSVNRISGYEHRPYVEGDSLKKVNWKVSSKKGELMVRKDESISSVKFILTLDYARGMQGDEAEILKAEEHIMESLLSIASYCVRKAIKCVALVGNNNEIYQSEIEDETDISRLAIDLVRMTFSTDFEEYDKNLLLKLNEFKGVKLVFSETYNKLFEGILHEESTDSSCHMILSSNDKKMQDLKLWYADKDYSIKHCG